MIYAILLTLYNEIRMGLHMSLHYGFNLSMRLLSMLLKFVGYSLFISHGSLDPTQLPPILIGYLVHFYATFVVIDVSFILREEVQEGTIEQLFMTPMPVELIFLGRIIATLVLTTVKAIIGLGTLALLLKITVPVTLAAIPVLLLTLVAITGLGLMLAAITLLTKRTQALAILVGNVLLFVSGTVLPISYLPYPVQLFAKTLPTTQGIIVLRSLLINSHTLGDVWANGSLGLLLITTTLYYLGGLVLFAWCVRAVKKQGTLGQY